MEVKKEYKRSEAGFIPEDWTVHYIGELLEFQGGSQPDKSVFRSVWKPGYTRLIQIRDYKTDRFATYVPSHLARRFCSSIDIMIGRYGPPIFQILKGIDGAYNVALIKVLVKPGVNRLYAYYFLKQDSLFSFIEKLSQRSSGQTGVDLKELRAYPVPLPPTLAEQEAIAGALSDADAWIESLEQLIAKKRQIKQGAMQELLTGKTRLPGFTGKWEQQVLRDCLHRPPDYGINAPGVESDGVLPSYLRITDIDDDGRLLGTNRVAVDHPASPNYILEPNDIVFARTGASVGKTYLYRPGDGSLVFAGFLIRAKVDQSKLSPEFLFAYTHTRPYWNWVRMMSMRSGQPGINSNEFASLELHLPTTLDEQAAISTVLSDMDAEIASLEAKLTKARQIKQGMMQELLTGRIRLV